MATDLEVSFKGFCGATVTEPGEITVPAHQLFSLVKESPGLAVDMETTERHALRLNWGDAKYQLNGLDPEQFPPVPEVESGTGVVNIPGNVLKGMIDKVLFSTGEDRQYDLNGVMWEKIEPDEDGTYLALRMVSTDGHRMTLIEREFPFASLLFLQQASIMVPLKGMREIARFADGQDAVGLALDDKFLYVIGEGKHLAVRLLDKRFPDYRRIIPPGFNHQFLVPREEFARTVKRLSLVETERFKGILLGLGAEEMSLSSSSPDMGEGQEKITGIQLLEGDPETLNFEMGFNAPYLLQPLSFMGNGHIIFSVNEEDRPARIMGADDPNYFSVVMPMSK
jgi:DNA polymerase-3 subunit beta